MVFLRRQLRLPRRSRERAHQGFSPRRAAGGGVENNLAILDAYSGAHQNALEIRKIVAFELLAHHVAEYRGAGKAVQRGNQFVRAPAPLRRETALGKARKRGIERMS